MHVSIIQNEKLTWNDSHFSVLQHLKNDLFFNFRRQPMTMVWWAPEAVQFWAHLFLAPVLFQWTSTMTSAHLTFGIHWCLCNGPSSLIMTSHIRRSIGKLLSFLIAVTNPWTGFYALPSTRLFCAFCAFASLLHLSIHLSITYLSVCLSDCLSVCLPV